MSVTVKSIEKKIDAFNQKSKASPAGPQKITLAEGLPILKDILTLVMPILRIFSKKAYNWLKEFLAGVVE